MAKRVTGVLLLLVIGVLLLVGGKYLLNYLDEKKQLSTSDAARTKGRIAIAMDSWIGYFPLCSAEMKGEMRHAGWLLECVDDKADYRGRMAGLEKGEYDLIVATIDSYLLNAASHNYPGAIIAVIDESKGGDAIIARRDRITNLDGVRNASDIRVAFTPESPSHFLLKAAANHFDLPALLPTSSTLRFETEGSDKALAKLMAGTTDIAVLWEPDVSRALSEPSLIKLLGTEETERLIVDILVANRRFMQQKPEVISLILSNYFKVLKKYRDDPEHLLKEVVDQTGLDKKAAQSMLKGVLWQGLIDNCEKWFGISSPGVRADEWIGGTIDSVVQILIDSGDFDRSPVPDKDNYRLLKRSFLEELYTAGITGFTKNAGGFAASGQDNKTLPPLDENGWARLSEVGTLRLKPIVFRHGSAALDPLSGLELDMAAEKLSHYPGFRVIVKGHTGTRGDSEQNMLLSKQRADSVVDFLVAKHGIDANRLRAVGYGGTKPLPRGQGESLRVYEQRLPRVEMVLVRDLL